MTEPGGRRIHVPIHLRWGDLDALNHVNNTSMLKLLEEARLRAFWRPDAGMEGPPTAVLESGLSTAAETVTLIARQEIEYLAPVPYQQRPLDVQLWIGRLGGSSIDVCYDVYSPLGETPRVHYARSTAVIVLVDTATGRPARLSREMRAAWEPYLDEPIVYAHRR
ncbi:acyl-CoA thioesterase [Microbacterium sp. zg.Y1090]|uniref:acyl-CoA thioesterase n=1 Tax=Microbacterium wangruii TaxID=3049073 RepID=UPI00214D47D2|nr:MULTISPECIES: thioesterase family protein [unclassified Microbacterium]MCR2818879.1 acyl-CoA thioesterase [Microbacterium sp. zg.Y1090]MDL5486970.1 thioesterase family protein [Microbacterium sp. zg-Y1211]WIM27191.1 thioesterase family protein [Microbacterium sp. zg-Y1090]